MEKDGCHRDLDELVWLSDRGINEAIQNNRINGVTPYPSDSAEHYDGEINPATINLSANAGAEIRKYQSRFVTHAPLEADEQFILFGDVRSRIRRHGLRVKEYSVAQQGFLITNRSPQDFVIDQGNAFCHVFVGCVRSSELAGLDHGLPAVTRVQARDLFKEGFMGYARVIEPEITEEGYIVLHASGKYNPGKEVEVCRTRNPITEKPESGDIIAIGSEGIQNAMDKPVSIVLEEQVVLSPHISLQLFNRDVRTGELHLGGIVDPGFKGELEYQPLIDGDRVFKPGDGVMYGRLIYFEKPVLRPYGHELRESSFQGYSFGEAGSSALSA